MDTKLVTLTISIPGSQDLAAYFEVRENWTPAVVAKQVGNALTAAGFDLIKVSMEDIQWGAKGE